MTAFASFCFVFVVVFERGVIVTVEFGFEVVEEVAGLAAAALGIKSMISKRLRQARNIRRERMNEHVPTKNDMTAWNIRRERTNEHVPTYPPSTYEQLRRVHGDHFSKWRA